MTYTKDDIEMALTVGANRVVSYFKEGDEYKEVEHIDKRRKTSKAAPLSRPAVTNGEMVETLRMMSEIDDIPVELFFKDIAYRVVIYDKGKHFSVENKFDKKWKFDWSDFVAKGFDFPE